MVQLGHGWKELIESRIVLLRFHLQLRDSKLHYFLLRAWRDVSQRVREQGRPAFSWSARLTIAATAAYVVATVFLVHQPLLAPLSALIVTQLTLYSVVRQGIERVLSVVAGVVIASIFASQVGLTWWSLAILIAVSLMIGFLLRLGDHLVEVPTTAMFVLAVQVGTTSAAFERVVATVIGAAVGLLINIVIPPGERSTSASAAVRRYGEDIARMVNNAAEYMSDEITKEQASAWLANARSLDYKTVHIDRLIDHAEENRLLNVRALHLPNTSRGLRGGLYALEHSAVAIRSVFRGISDVVYYPDDVEDTFPQASRNMTKLVLEDIATSVVCFGNLVEADMSGAKNKAQTESSLLLALDQLSESRKLAKERLAKNEDSPAVQELNTFLVATVGRILREFDLRGHTWLTDRTAPMADQQSRALYAAKRLQARTRDLAKDPLRRHRRP